MCGRGSLTKAKKELEKRFQATFYLEELERYDILPNFNVAPTHFHPVITNQNQAHFQFYKWGLVPFWAKEEKIGSKMINARIESITEKPAFRQAIQKRRCIVPFDGFYEWKKKGKQKIPYRISRKDDQLFSIAGIWEEWKTSSGASLHSFSVLTQTPNAMMTGIHDRMPAILLPEQESFWLDGEISGEEAIKLIAPYPDHLLKAYPVSSKVNNVRTNTPDLIIEVDEPPLINQQGTLF